MELYKKLYLKLFNTVTDALTVISDRPEDAAELLIAGQQQCEKIFLSGEAETKEE